MRTGRMSRKTKETDIQLELNLDGTGIADVNTGIGFFDHMLISFAKHAEFDLKVHADGDLYVDEHHLIEDTAIVLGKVLADALGDMTGIARFGEARIPMDEALAEVALDIGGRSYLVLNAEFSAPQVGQFSTQLVKHFFEALASNAKITIHASVYGDNDHHKIEALFKAFAYAMKRAVKVEGKEVKSTKGLL
ncbi:MAG: imidazoleglycerol-phosphate dehydratase HisB [Methanosarcina thermophila]|jgi:imidazoleglycerol-phosphate dehydratase|uniref:Imidazoleglycerol-phosphate dehydratase n=4 Tax=Methanosarcina thermophila TaxID=2210 RepID=A0A0E3NI00_METTE|nr:imidazoleglycerol-phosphate dehydratase HisB [Methanosarcina thermophila]ALK05019.1 MAG: imidazoleglycerol-phosphate dehydratase [Methanosarcina sp. 795]AKB15605.1 Imidazoleglycerol-phosphate dehydratase [Methanosarcina thermophila CHTI-55]NLU57828.1 imidazoleglycerol-phosphate dehydratase HisB [Methanosarcina thermophila]BAW28782.1 imidazoleglycerol-phosphate dehydratase [Methanosarcina thermophila]GLI15052.1 imidazoleglycerol-phosphate dehydratase [Methanosarcina thermophila MST-A1]